MLRLADRPDALAQAAPASPAIAQRCPSMDGQAGRTRRPWSGNPP